MLVAVAHVQCGANDELPIAAVTEHDVDAVTAVCWVVVGRTICSAGGVGVAAAASGGPMDAVRPSARAAVQTWTQTTSDGTLSQEDRL